MTRYFFDLRDGEDLALDEEGLELATEDAAKKQAVRSLAGMARGEILLARHASQSSVHDFAVEVRDAEGPVFRVRFFFEADRTRH